MASKPVIYNQQYPNSLLWHLDKTGVLETLLDYIKEAPDEG